MTRMLRTVSALLLVMPLVGNASTWTGKTNTVRYGSASTRVSILAGSHSSPCAANPTWFAFENTNAAAVAMWASALIEAQNAGRTVYIKGTGVCDSYGVETVDYIDFK